MADNPISKAERDAETALLEILAQKGQLGLFAEIKSKVFEVAVSSDACLLPNEFGCRFEPIISKIQFEGKIEALKFLDTFMDYINAVGWRSSGYRQGKGK